MSEIIPARLLTVSDVNGSPVSFFSPPHSGLDLPWVDVRGLTFALLKDDIAADRFVSHAWRFSSDSRICTTAVNDDKIVTIIPHVIAQGLAGALDAKTGFIKTEDEDDGPLFREYCLRAALVAVDHWPLEFSQLFQALANCGGPFMAHLREETQ